MAIYYATSCFSMHKVPYAPGAEIELTADQAERFIRAKLVAEKPTVRKQPKPTPKKQEEPAKPKTKRRKAKAQEPETEPETQNEAEIEIEDVDA